MLRIGVLGPADIAKRRMVPAIKKSEKLEYIGVAVATSAERGETISPAEEAAQWERRKEKAAVFTELFGGKVFEGYEAMLQSGEIDAVYIPLPPSLHFQWAQKALRHGKHVLLEKPFTVSYADTERLIQTAREKGLAVFENYGFIYHGQMNAMEEALANGALGELRLIRAAFAFPYRGGDDFRYHAALGGGALLDCGGYTLRAAEHFLAGELKVAAKKLYYRPEHDVDMYGSVTLEDGGQCAAQLFFGMDNAYVCKLELWGTKGCVFTERAFTAPDQLAVPVTLRGADGEKQILIPADDQFLKAADKFADAVLDGQTADNLQREILRHARLMEAVMP